MASGKAIKLDAIELTRAVDEDWKNFPVCSVNDHTVSLSAVKPGFGVDWHSHAAGDELLYVVSGRIRVELEGRAEELAPGQMILLPAGARHRTTALDRSVVMCLDRAGTSMTGD